MKKRYFLLIIIIFYSWFHSIESIEISGEIGKYLNHPLENGKKTTLVNLGNGLFYDGISIKGWPTRIGSYKYNNFSLDIDIKIHPKFSNPLQGVDGKYFLRWDSILRNNVIYVDKQNKTKYISPIAGVKWDLTTSPLFDKLAWIQFDEKKPGDKIYYLDTNSGIYKTIEGENTIHRKPLLSNEALYWYQEKMESNGDRLISVCSRSFAEYNTPDTCINSEYPNTITDYTVLNSGDIAVIKKNYDQQRSEILFYKNNRKIHTYFQEDSYIQNINAVDSSVLFEIKKHGELWWVQKYGIESGLLKIGNETTNTIIEWKDNENWSIKSAGNSSSFYDIYNIILNRFSPQIYGLSGYDNSLGTLSISEAPIIRSLLNVSKSTGELSYAYIAAERVKKILSNMKLDRKSNIHYWGVRAFNKGKSEKLSFLVHDASILDAMLLVAKRLKSDDSYNQSYPGLYEQILNLFYNNFLFHSKNIVRKENDIFSIINKGELYFTFDKGTSYQYDGVNLPFNMMNSYIRPLVYYSELTGDNSYLEIATSLGRLFKRHMIHNEADNLYIWPYWWGLYDSGWNVGEVSQNTPSHPSNSKKYISDVDHASLDIRGILTLFGKNIVFDEIDVKRVVNTMLSNINNGDYRSGLLIDGDILSANYNSIEYLWGELAGQDYQSFNAFRNGKEKLPYVQDAFTPTARYELVGLSHLIKAEKEFITK